MIRQHRNDRETRLAEVVAEVYTRTIILIFILQHRQNANKWGTI
jgi:hypothetical protein